MLLCGWRGGLKGTGTERWVIRHAMANQVVDTPRDSAKDHRGVRPQLVGLQEESGRDGPERRRDWSHSATVELPYPSSRG